MKIYFFHAPWCSNCHTFSPIVFRVKEKLGIEVEDIDVTTPKGEGLAYKYSVMGLPTLIFLEGGKEIGRVTSVLPEDILVEKIKQLSGVRV